jgi:hypothetical protein
MSAHAILEGLDGGLSSSFLNLWIGRDAVGGRALGAREQKIEEQLGRELGTPSPEGIGGRPNFNRGSFACSIERNSGIQGSSRSDS